MIDLIYLTGELCQFKTGIVAEGNELFFQRFGKELPIDCISWKSLDEYNRRVIPQNWTVEKA